MKCDEKELSSSDRFKPESSSVIVCEGFRDAGFICALLKHLRIDTCDVAFPKKKRDGAEGESGIAAMVSLICQAEIVNGIAVIRDSDGNATNSFRAACEGFAKPFGCSERSLRGYTRTENCSHILNAGKRGKLGLLEHLLLEAVFAKHEPLATCIRAWENCSNQQIANWSDNKKAKMRMQSVIASFCKDDPACSGFIWNKGVDNPIDITSPVFSELSGFLRDFAGTSTDTIEGTVSTT